MKYYEFTAGILLCGKIRGYLRRAQFNGYKFEWIESGGFISHEFTLKSADDTAIALGRDLATQCEENGWT